MPIFASLLPPYGNRHGNVLWAIEDQASRTVEIEIAIRKLSMLGYWASAFPEGDGVTFSAPAHASEATMLEDFSDAFSWLTITLKSGSNGNDELSDLDGNRMILCNFAVPLEKIFIEEYFHFAGYHFFPRRLDGDIAAYDDRVDEFEQEYIEFELLVSNRDLLRTLTSIDAGNRLINRVLNHAEKALDIIRTTYSRFDRPQFTPNPAGQGADGFYRIYVEPRGTTHFKPTILSGISRPVSVHNNWLGPQVDIPFSPELPMLVDMINGTISGSLIDAALTAMRSCRHAFYAIAPEAQFLSLVFALDGLICPDPKWTGWKHRTFIAAAISQCDIKNFRRTLINYDSLYVSVRNKLVHDAKNFDELPQDPAVSSQEIYQYIKDVVEFVGYQGFSDQVELNSKIVEFLKTSTVKTLYTEVITEVSATRGKNAEFPKW